MKKTIIFYCGVLSLSISISFICPFVLSASPIDFCIFCVCVRERARARAHGVHILMHKSIVTFAPNWISQSVARNKWNTLYWNFRCFFLLTRAITLKPWKWFMKNSFIKKKSYHFCHIVKEEKKQHWFTSKLHDNKTKSQTKCISSSYLALKSYLQCECVCVFIVRFNFRTCRCACMYMCCLLTTNQDSPHRTSTYLCMWECVTL